MLVNLPDIIIPLAMPFRKTFISPNSNLSNQTPVLISNWDKHDSYIMVSHIKIKNISPRSLYIFFYNHLPMPLSICHTVSLCFIFILLRSVIGICHSMPQILVWIYALRLFAFYVFGALILHRFRLTTLDLNKFLAQLWQALRKGPVIVT